MFPSRRAAARSYGDLTNDPALHDEGVADEAAGRATDAFGRAKRKMGEVGTKDFAHTKGTKAPEGATAGGGTGALVGGTLGWLVGIGTLAL